MEFRLESVSYSASTRSSFNPCFSGYGIQTSLPRSDVSSVSVSILVFLDMEFRLLFRCLHMRLKKVSILVFLDMEFRPCGILIHGGRGFCFNPCFSGYGIQTFCGRWDLGYNQLFQSLFFWIWNSDYQTIIQ